MSARKSWLRKLAANQRFQKAVGGGILERVYLNTLSRVQLLFLGAHKDKEVVGLIRRTRRERKSLLTAYECYIVYSLARAQSERPGDMAEVGVYQGSSAKLLCEARGDKTLHLFDTFEGLPEAAKPDGRVHDEKQYSCSLESVRTYLEGYENLHFYKGRFPESAAQLPDVTFSFAHFDVDLYESTLACLEYFYPKMIPGGVILSHDYSILAGVRSAFDEFIEDKPEAVVELPSTQCMLIKL